MTIAPHHPVPTVGSPFWVYIPCPASLAVEASTLIADLMAKRGTGDAFEGPAASAGGLAPADPAERGSFSTRVGNANGVWNAEGYAALRAKDTLSARRAVSIGDVLCAAGPETLVAMRDLAQRTEMSTNQVTSALSKLSNFIAVNREIYPDYVWPFGWYYGRKINPQRPREFHYVMTAPQCRAWESNR